MHSDFSQKYFLKLKIVLHVSCSLLIQIVLIAIQYTTSVKESGKEWLTYDLCCTQEKKILGLLNI